MQVIGAGFGRTGTESMKVALERLLGGPCYHMKEVMANDGHLRRWEAFALAGRRDMDWRALLAGYEAGVDWPICNYYRELMAEFPEAKVVLTLREPDKWFDSFQILVRFSRLTGQLGVIVPRFRRFRTFIDGAVWHIFGDRADRRDRAHCIEVFNRHVEAVKASVPADRLLLFRVQEGWGPLCEFLRLPVPDEPFPHINSRRQVKGMMRSHILKALAKSPLGVAVSLAVLAGLVVWLV